MEWENTRFRVTFDNQIIWRDYDLELSKGVYGEEDIAYKYVLKGN